MQLVHNYPLQNGHRLENLAGDPSLAQWSLHVDGGQGPLVEGEGSGTKGEGSGTVGEGSGTVGEESGTVGEGSGTVGEESGTVGEESGTVGEESGTVGEESGTVRGMKLGLLNTEAEPRPTSLMPRYTSHRHSSLHANEFHRIVTAHTKWRGCEEEDEEEEGRDRRR
ncbi:hypothetical protein Pmani_013288 [Petrolisthes manimaculis]|uniref:Uncharacterized protein n=1 Tax=Petrolisthes manimaculis TaxID=1843537 RepID=A0AAE1UCB2_9EUCA|nr:hypothetical protein Pmani_013288 [Petrolisthes manimaculis]